MTDYLVYWKTYWNYENNGSRDAMPYWYTNNKRFYDKVMKNDRLWVVINGGVGAPNEWRLLHRFTLSGKNPKTVKSDLGKYEIIGSRKENIKFAINNQPDLTAILWMLEFSTGTHIRFLGQKIGQALQTNGHRTLSANDVVLLNHYIKCLKRKK